MIEGPGEEDGPWMGTCVDYARNVASAGYPPIVAIVVKEDSILGRGQSGEDGGRLGGVSSIAHAELLAILEATTSAPDLVPGSVLYSTLEPCLMCLGVAANAGVRKVVYAYPAAPDGASWVASTQAESKRDDGRLPIPELVGPVRADVMQSLFSEFLSKNSMHPGAGYVRDIVSMELAHLSAGSQPATPTDFDAYYADEEWSFGDEPTAIVRRFAEQLDPDAQIVELGAGDGRDALYLATKVALVVALDISEVAISKLNEKAKRDGLPVQAEVFDISQLAEFGGQFDGIVSITSLDHLSEREISEAIVAIWKKLKDNGLVAIQAHTRLDPGFLRLMGRSETSDWVRYYFRPKELYARFSQYFEIEFYNEWSELDHDHGPVHSHSFVGLIARKKAAVLNNE